jgi:PAS domain S-box-containing protein
VEKGLDYCGAECTVPTVLPLLSNRFAASQHGDSRFEHLIITRAADACMLGCKLVISRSLSWNCVMGDEARRHADDLSGPRRRTGTEDAVERKGIELELNAAHERLQHVLAVCPAIIYTTQASGDYSCTFVSENIKEILGYTQSEMLDDPDFWTTHIHPQDTRRVMSEVFRLISEGGGNLEYRFRHRDGHFRWFQDSFKTVYDSANLPVEIVGSWADITQRKLAESFQTLYQASFKIHEPLGLKKWFDGFLRTARDVLHLDRLSILLADPERRWLQAVASTETEEPLEAIRVPIGPSGGGLAKAYQTQQAVICDGQSQVADELRLKAPYDRIKAFDSRVFAIMPLVLQKQTVGVLEAGWKGNRPFDSAAIEPLQLLASQAAVASEHSRLFAAAQPVLRRSLQLTDVYPAFAAAVKALLAYDRIGVVVPEKGKLLMALSVAEPPLASWQGESWSETEGTAGAWVLSERKPRIVRDIVVEHTFSDDKFLLDEGIRSTLMLPLLAGEEAVGFFFLDNRTPGAYTERDLELLDPVAQQLALAIQNNRLLKELQEQSRELARSVEEMKVLREVGQAINASLDLQTVLTTIVAHAVDLSGTDAGAMHEYDQESGTFMLRATHGMDDELVAGLRTNQVKFGEGIFGRAGFTREPISFSDIALDTDDATLKTLMARSGFKAILNVPLLGGNRLFGGLSVIRKSTGDFPPETVELLKTFATQSVLAIQNARQFQELEVKGHQLEIASKHKSQFLANMSHELRTPLNAILGYSELMLDNIYGDVPTKMREPLLRLDKNGRHLLGLINDVLDLSKIEAGLLTLSIRDYSMKEVVQGVVASVESLATEKNLPVKVTVEDLPRGRGDDRRITQVLLNLVGNALKFTEAGEIRIEAKTSQDNFLISVVDTGPGIAESDQQKIFEEFHQAESSSTRKKGGTGLGLSIAKRIIHLHGGRIWVESHPGQGSTFRFSLPVRVDCQAEVR